MMQVSELIRTNPLFPSILEDLVSLQPILIRLQTYLELSLKVNQPVLDSKVVTVFFLANVNTINRLDFGTGTLRLSLQAT